MSHADTRIHTPRVCRVAARRPAVGRFEPANRPAGRPVKVGRKRHAIACVTSGGEPVLPCHRRRCVTLQPGRCVTRIALGATRPMLDVTDHVGLMSGVGIPAGCGEPAHSGRKIICGKVFFQALPAAILGVTTWHTTGTLLAHRGTRWHSFSRAYLFSLIQVPKASTDESLPVDPASSLRAELARSLESFARFDTLMP